MNELELKENGYTILKQIIPKEDIEMYRKVLGECGEKAFHDCINNPKLDSFTKVFTYDKLNTFLQTITDYTLTYCHHFDIWVGKRGSRWHDDTQAFYKNSYYGSRVKKYKEGLGVCPHDMIQPLPNGDTYKIYRVGIYLQDTKENERGGLALFKGSHLDAKCREVVIPEIEDGDVIVFDARTIHTANGLPVGNNNRIAMFFAVGKDNIFTEFHISGAIKRQNRLRKDLVILGDNVAKVLRENGYMF